MDYSKQNQSIVENNILNERFADYEKAEIDLLRDALNRSFTERFLMATTLYKIQRTMSKAVITHKPYNLYK